MDKTEPRPEAEYRKTGTMTLHCDSSAIAS